MTKNDIGKRIEEHFAAFDRTDFVRWLKEGLRYTYLPSDSKKTHPFDPVYPEIVYQDIIKADGTVCDFLGRVYDKFFSYSGKKMFREAIGDVLSTQINQMELTIEACKDLMYLVFEVRAEESLDSLVSFAVEEELEEKGEALYVAIAVLKTFEPSNNVYKTVEKLSDSLNFDEGFLFEVIEILVKNQPLNTRNILEKFESRINAFYNSMPNNEERKVFLERKEECLKFISKKANPVQYKDTWLTKDYRLLDKVK